MFCLGFMELMNIINQWEIGHDISKGCREKRNKIKRVCCNSKKGGRLTVSSDVSCKFTIPNITT